LAVDFTGWEGDNAKLEEQSAAVRRSSAAESTRAKLGEREGRINGPPVALLDQGATPSVVEAVLCGGGRRFHLYFGCNLRVGS
jgi:hypothetical protein